MTMERNYEQMIEYYKRQLEELKEQAARRGMDPGITVPTAESEPPAQIAYPGRIEQLEDSAITNDATSPATVIPAPMSSEVPRDTPLVAKRSLPDGEGYIKVQAVMADGAMPVSEAKVTIFKQGREVTHTLTNESGETVEIPLPAPNKELSGQYEDGVLPFAVYNVHTEKEDYIPVQNLNVPVFDGIVSIQTVNMRRQTASTKETVDVFDEAERLE